jgi:hypothetical protein
VLVVRTKKPFIELQSAHIGLERSTAPVLGKAERSRMLRNNPTSDIITIFGTYDVVMMSEIR